MKKIFYLFLFATILIQGGCSTAYTTYSQKIEISATPKEIFDINVDLRFISATKLEKKRLKEQLAEKGLKIFTGYTRGMIQGTVILDRQFISAIRSFVNDYKQYGSSNEQAIFDEILKALDELDEYLNKQGIK